MANLYAVYNGVSPTTAAVPSVTTGVAIKTLLQLATVSTEDLIVVEWGISFDGTAATTPIKCELIDTSVAATVTTLASADCVKLTGPNDVAPSSLSFGVAATGFTASAEGTVVASRLLDYQLIAPTGGYVKQFPLGREPKLGASRFLRIRVTASAAVNASCYVVFSE